MSKADNKEKLYFQGFEAGLNNFVQVTYFDGISLPFIKVALSQEKTE